MGYDVLWLSIAIAYVLDFILGDPQGLPHPIRLMGRAIETGEPVFRKIRLPLVITGGLFALFLIGMTWITAYFLVKAAFMINGYLGVFIQTLFIYYCMSARSLETAGSQVGHALCHTGLEAAKEKLKMIVGRQVEPLSKTGVVRATIETVAENLVDGFISPVFFAALGGAPLALTYKMINTLDSMVGYKNDAYLQFGKAAARIDDAANYIPARLSVPVICLASQALCGKGKVAAMTAGKDGSKHKSPNAGWPEAAFAGALGIRLGGPNYYHGKRVEKPFIGTRHGKALPGHIKKACDIMLLSTLIWTAMACMLSLWQHQLF